MNIWRRANLERNPYYRTVFRVTRVPRNITRRNQVVALLGQTKRVVTMAPQEHTIQGERVTTAELNSAEQTLLDANQRILHELIHHAAERLPPEPVRELAAEVARRLAGDGAGAEAVTNLKSLALLAEHLVTLAVEAEPDDHLSFGALELELSPPFGPIEDQ